MKKLRQVIALGGGGFSMEPENPLLDKYILNSSGKENPKICFFANAGGDAQDYIDRFYDAFQKQNCIPSHISLLDLPKGNLEEIILSNDIVFVGGGSTRILMQQWKQFGIDKIMCKAWEKGIVLSGMSAGAIVWFQDGLYNPTDKELMRIDCLGFVKGSFCPHYDERTELRFSYRNLITAGNIKAGYGAEDYCGLHFIGNDLYNVISSRKNAAAYSVRKAGRSLSEKKIETVYLGYDEKYFSLMEVDEKITSVKNTKEISEYKNSVKNGSEVAENILDPDTQLVLDYIDKINHHDIEGLSELMTEDHLFSDSTGVVINGKDEMKLAWFDFFVNFPDYTIVPDDIIIDNGAAAVFGVAKGTYYTEGELTDKNKFKVSAAWKAIISNSKISEWKVYADFEPVRKIVLSKI